MTRLGHFRATTGVFQARSAAPERCADAPITESPPTVSIFAPLKKLTRSRSKFAVAYVPGFEHDVFVSYAHADDAMDPHGVQWVTDFQIFFRRALKQHLGGNEPDIFFDALELHANQPIRIVLDKARRSAVFVPILSTSYVERTWTTEELRAFREAGSEEGRIFAIELLPPVSGYPEPIEVLKRQIFWLKDEKQGIAPRRLTPKYKPDLYSDRLGDVAYLVAQRLRNMRPADASPPKRLTGKTVLLAKVTDDLRRQREEVRKYLESYGANVIPREDYPDEGATLRERFTQDITRAHLFVQLLSEVRSMRLEDMIDRDTPSVGKFQFDLALRNRVPLLQWLHPDARPETVTHFDKQLIDGSLEGSRVERTGLVQFKDSIKRMLERQIEAQATPEPPPPAPADNRPLRVFIHADPADLDLARKLMEEFSRHDCRVALPATDGSAKDIRRDFRSNIMKADALLFVYGKVRQIWVRSQLERYDEIGRTSPPLLAVYIAPPDGKPDVDIQWPELRRFDCRQSFSLGPVQEIIRELRH